jgi:hypothetical protein
MASMSWLPITTGASQVSGPANGQALKERFAVFVIYGEVYWWFMLEKNHVDLVIVKQKIDTSMVYGNFYCFMEAIKDIECGTKGEYIRFVLQDMQKRGHRVSRFPPYGSMIDPTDDARLVPNREEIVTIEKIMNLHKEGYTLEEICAELTRMCRKPRGKAWHAGTIRRIIAKYTNG